LTASHDLHLLTRLRGRNRWFALVSKSRAPLTIEKVWGNPKARMFADLLESNNAIQGIFLHHWKQLTFLEDFSLPVFFSSAEIEQPAGMLARSASEGEAQLGFTMERIFASARPQIEEAVKKFAKRLEAQGVDPDNPNKEAFMSVLLQMMGVFSGGSPTKALFTVLKPFEDLFADELTDIGGLIVDSTKTAALSAGFARRQALLQNSELSVGEYEKGVGGLVADDYLVPALSLMWCNDHGKYPRSFYLAGHKSLPGKATCDLCRRRLKSGTYLVPSSAAMILSRRYEGALPCLMAWDLERNAIPWNANVYLKDEDDTEKDLVFARPKAGGVSIVECKTYYRDTNDRVKRDNLAGLLRQLEQHVQKYVARGIRVTEAIPATNYPVTDEMEKFVAETITEKRALNELKKVRVRLIGPGNLANWWKG
jgi:hypothetical protein